MVVGWSDDGGLDLPDRGGVLMADFAKGGIMFRTLTDEECGADGHQQHDVKFADDRLFGTSCECGDRWTSEYVQPSRKLVEES